MYKAIYRIYEPFLPVFTLSAEKAEKQRKDIEYACAQRCNGDRYYLRFGRKGVRVHTDEKTADIVSAVLLFGRDSFKNEVAHKGR